MMRGCLAAYIKAGALLGHCRTSNFLVAVRCIHGMCIAGFLSPRGSRIADTRTASLVLL